MIKIITEIPAIASLDHCIISCMDFFLFNPKKYTAAKTAINKAIVESPIKERKIRNEFSLAKIIFAITEIVINKTGDKAIQKLVRTGGNVVSAVTFEVPKS